PWHGGQEHRHARRTPKFWEETCTRLGACASIRVNTIRPLLSFAPRRCAADGALAFLFRAQLQSTVGPGSVGPAFETNARDPGRCEEAQPAASPNGWTKASTIRELSNPIDADTEATGYLERLEQCCHHLHANPNVMEGRRREVVGSPERLSSELARTIR